MLAGQSQAALPDRCQVQGSCQLALLCTRQQMQVSLLTSSVTYLLYHQPDQPLKSLSSNCPCLFSYVDVALL